MTVKVGVKEKVTVTVIVSSAPVSKLVLGSDVEPTIEPGPGDMVQ